MGTPAKVLAPRELCRVQRQVARGRYPLRNNVMVLLSFKAGLRACEIAGIDWTMVLDPSGRVSTTLMIGAGIAKNGKARRLPLHDELRAALQQLNRSEGRPRHGPVIRSQRADAMTPRSVVNWFKWLYDEVGLSGCSSHSGRRTFITRSARLISRAGGSLRDVQELAGHRDLSTTQRYIEGDRDAQRKLVAML
jgi:integrase/recombinase XerD